MTGIFRKEYMDILLSMRDKRVIKVVTGIRRCGKSTLLEMYQNYLMENGVSKEQIISVNFEDMDYSELKDKAVLHSYVKERLAGDKMHYVFFDEIQLVEDFPEVVDSLYLRTNVDLYLTGSNAKMLSSEIATLISGRYIEVPMLPLSFKEYASGSGNLSEQYRDYLQSSSFPYVMELDGNQKLIDDYLQNLYNTVILKDVVARNKIVDVLMIESIIRFAFDNIGNMLSSKSIADAMTSGGRKIDTRTVEKYLNALTECYLLYKAERYDIKGKQYLKSLEKYYAVDIGIRRTLLGNRSSDVGHILENVVYLELLRRGNKVYIGKTGSTEVDFVADDGESLRYYQVAATVRDETTLQRELKPLQDIRDHYPKMLLTLDEDPDADFGGILRTNALQWLVNK